MMNRIAQVNVRIFALLILLGSVFTACQNKDVETLQAENEELKKSIQKDSLYIVDMTAEMDELYSNLDELREMEAKVRQATAKMKLTKNGAEGSTIDESLERMEAVMAQNRKKIRALQSKLGKSEKENKLLQKMIEELNKSIQDRDQQISDLKLQVTELQDEVAGWKSKYALETAAKDSVQNALANAEDQLNQAYYALGTKKELKKRGIIVTKGLKGTVKGLGLKGSMTQIDIRYENRISLGSKKIKQLFPSRPSGSYQESKEGGDNILVIKDPSAFWSKKHLAIILE